MDNTIYAVIWVDFGVPLSLKSETGEDAILMAKHMWLKSNQSLANLRAVALTDDDKLHTLWEPERNPLVAERKGV